MLCRRHCNAEEVWRDLAFGRRTAIRGAFELVLAVLVTSLRRSYHCSGSHHHLELLHFLQHQRNLIVTYTPCCFKSYSGTVPEMGY